VTDKGAIQRANERVIIILTEKSTIWLMGGKDLIQCQIIFVKNFPFVRSWFRKRVIASVFSEYLIIHGNISQKFLTGFKYPIHRFQNGRFFCKALQLEVLSSLVPFF